MNNFLKGALFGVGIGLLIAPMRGEEMRRLVSQRTQELRGYLPENEQLSQYSSQVSDRVSQTAGTLKDYAQQAATTVKSTANNLGTLAQSAATNVKQTGQDLAQQTKDAASNVKDQNQDLVDSAKETVKSAKNSANTTLNNTNTPNSL